MFSLFLDSDAKSASSALLKDTESFVWGSRHGWVHGQERMLHFVQQSELQLKIVSFKKTIIVRVRKEMKIVIAK